MNRFYVGDLVEVYGRRGQVIFVSFFGAGLRIYEVAFEDRKEPHIQSVMGDAMKYVTK